MTNPNRRHFNPGLVRRQRGVVMVIALIILMLVTMLSVSAMSVNVQAERMAGNTRDRDLAFQAAEAAVMYCLNQVKASSSWSGIITQAASTAMPNWETASTWSGTSSTTVSMGSGTTYLAASPKCIAESIGGGTYLITGRAVGGSTSAVVILQATYTP
jgi:type IV pilus assembly protein PilX